MPDSWELTTLGEIAHIKQGETIAVRSLSGGTHPVFGANGIVGWHEIGNIAEETVALGCRGSCGAIHMAPSGAFLANNVMGVRAIDGVSVVGFLAVLLEVADLRGNGVISGQVQEQITRKSLSPLPVRVPPLPQQRRIVDLVGSIDTCIDSLETQIDTTRTARSALLSELLSNPGDDWQETTLDSLIALTIGGVWGADPGEDEVDVPIYRQTEFDDAGRLHQPAGAIRSITYRQLASRTLEENDVLIQKSAGTPTLPGRVVLVPELSEASSFSNFLNLIRADRQAVEPVFLFLVLQHLHATKVAFEFQRGTNIRNLDLKSYLAKTLLVPPLEEQRRIVDLVGSIDEQISSLESQVESVRTFRRSVLSELLSGERLLDESYDVAVGL